MKLMSSQLTATLLLILPFVNNHTFEQQHKISLEYVRIDENDQVIHTHT